MSPQPRRECACPCSLKTAAIPIAFSDGIDGEFFSQSGEKHLSVQSVGCVSKAYQRSFPKTRSRSQFSSACRPCRYQLIGFAHLCRRQSGPRTWRMWRTLNSLGFITPQRLPRDLTMVSSQSTSRRRVIHPACQLAPSPLCTPHYGQERASDMSGIKPSLRGHFHYCQGAGRSNAARRDSSSLMHS